MRSHLRPRVLWYVVMNILEEYSESVFTGHQKMDSPCPDQTSVFTSQIPRSHNP